MAATEWCEIISSGELVTIYKIRVLENRYVYIAQMPALCNSKINKVGGFETLILCPW